jgi:hypothetical protein
MLADYTFFDALWSMFVFFIWVLWLLLLFRIFGDIFRRTDISGWGKAGWSAFVIFLPFLGVFVYLIANGTEMAHRQVAAERSHRAQFDEYVRETAGGGGAAAEIAKAKELLDAGAISQAEFEALKAKALS